MDGCMVTVRSAGELPKAMRSVGKVSRGLDEQVPTGRPPCFLHDECDASHAYRASFWCRRLHREGWMDGWVHSDSANTWFGSGLSKKD